MFVTDKHRIHRQLFLGLVVANWLECLLFQPLVQDVSLDDGVLAPPDLALVNQQLSRFIKGIPGLFHGFPGCEDALVVAIALG